MELSIDPHNNSFNSINDNSCFTLLKSLTKSLRMENDQSYTLTAGLYANIANIKDYLGQITQSFNNTAIEMWIYEEDVADFDLDGCEFIHLDWQHKAGGGVAFFVVISNMLSCISVGIYNGNK